MSNGPSRTGGMLHPVISLWQPWASWILWGWKRVETRLHYRFELLERKRVGIHAAQTWDTAAIPLAKRWLTREQIHRTTLLSRNFPRGVILCSAFVYRHELTLPVHAAAALIECETPRVGLFLKEIRPIEPPFPVKGRQGIFYVQMPTDLEPLFA